MSFQIFTVLGESIGFTIFGMAFVSFRRKSNEPPIPSFLNGGFQLFLKTWGVTFVCALIVEIVLASLGVPDSTASAFGLLIPSVAAFYFVKSQLAARKT
jgi:hypothetical protein